MIDFSCIPIILADYKNRRESASFRSLSLLSVFYYAHIAYAGSTHSLKIASKPG